MKKIKSFITRNKLFRIWLAYYLIVLITVGTIMSTGYFTLMKRYQNEIQNSNELNLTHIQLLTENILSEAATLAGSLTSNTDLLQISDLKTFSISDRVNFINICKNLLSQPLLNNNIENYYIYLKNSDYIISPLSATDAKTSVIGLHSKNRVDIEKLYNLFDEFHNCSFIALPGQTTATSQIACLKTLDTNPGNTPSVTAVIMINTDKLRASIKSAMKSNSGELLIYNKENELMFSTSDNGEFDTKNMFVATTTSEVSDWTFKSIIPKTALFKQFAYTKNLVLCTVIVALLSGIALSLYFAMKNYRPIVEIEDIIQSRTSKKQTGAHDSLSFIKNAFISEINEKNKPNSLLVQNGFFRQLYAGESKNTEDIKKAFEYFDITPILDSYCVAIFFTDDYSGFSNENFPSEKNITLGNFALTNILTEISDEFEYIISEIDSKITVLYKINDEKDRNELLSFLNDFKNTVKDTISLTVSISVSTLHSKAGGYKNAFDEANSFYEHSPFPSGGNIISSAISEKSFTIDNHLQALLSEAIINGNADKAINITENIINEGIKNRLSVAGITTLIKDITALLFYITKTSGVPVPALSKDFTNKNILSVYMMNDVKKELFSLIKEICFYSQKNTSVPHNKSLSAQIKAFLDENYNDMNISVNYLADLFGCSRNYISKTFKNETETALTDYINIIRIKKAKDLLKNSNHTISVIAELVGYTNDNTFTRIFKKYEYITPGQYRTQNSFFDNQS